MPENVCSTASNIYYLAPYGKNLLSPVYGNLSYYLLPINSLKSIYGSKSRHIKHLMKYTWSMSFKKVMLIYVFMYPATMYGSDLFPHVHQLLRLSWFKIFTNPIGEKRYSDIILYLSFFVSFQVLKNKFTFFLPSFLLRCLDFSSFIRTLYIWKIAIIIYIANIFSTLSYDFNSSYDIFCHLSFMWSSILAWVYEWVSLLTAMLLVLCCWARCQLSLGFYDKYPEVKNSFPISSLLRLF